MRKLRTKVTAIALAFALGVSAPAALPSRTTTTVASAATVKLSQTKVSLKVGQTKQLKLSGAKKTVTWSSSKKSVATVSKSGKVTAKVAGTATITAKTSGKKYTCKVTVTDKKADNQTLTVDNVTFDVPSTVVYETQKEDSVIAMGISSKGNEHEAIILSNYNYEGLQITYEQWAEGLKTQLDSVAATPGLKDYKQEDVKTNIGDGILVSYKIEGETGLTMVAYEMYVDEHYIEVAYMYDNTVTSLELQSTFDMIMKTIAVVK